MFQMAQTPVDQAAGAGGIKIVFSLYSLNNISFQHDHEFKKIMVMRRILSIRVILYGNRFLIQNSFFERKGDYVHIALGIGVVAAFQCDLKRDIHAVKTAEIAFTVLHINGGVETV